MKKRAFCLLLTLLALFCLTAHADNGANFYRRLQYGQLAPYENAVYGYSLNVYEGFQMLSDEYMDELWQRLEANREEGDDEVYDLRIWLSRDGRYQFEVQVKEPTYDSFDTEIAKAPEYLSLVQDSYPEGSNPRMIHDGVLRKTPVGTMLETALAYDATDDSGHAYTVVFLYYDIYADDTEYCFTMFAYDGDYDAAQAMLDEICQTVSLEKIALPA